MARSTFGSFWSPYAAGARDIGALIDRAKLALPRAPYLSVISMPNKDRLKSQTSVHEEPALPSPGELFAMKTPMEILKPVLERQAPFEVDPFPGLRASTGHPRIGDSMGDVRSQFNMGQN